MCVCVCVGGRERIGQRKDFSKSSVALKERLYLARLRGLVNMYFVKQTAIAMGTPEIARKSKGEKKKKKQKDGAMLFCHQQIRRTLFFLPAPSAIITHFRVLMLVSIFHVLPGSAVGAWERDWLSKGIFPSASASPAQGQGRGKSGPC